MFLQLGLDRANQLDAIGKIPLCAHGGGSRSGLETAVAVAWRDPPKANLFNLDAV
jgi:hypothetical protein